MALGPIGMPGCTGYMSTEGVDLVFGANNTATFTRPVPDQAVLVGLHFHQQAVVLDPGAGNTFGAVMSDAATAVIGR